MKHSALEEKLRAQGINILPRMKGPVDAIEDGELGIRYIMIARTVKLTSIDDLIKLLPAEGFSLYRVFNTIVRFGVPEICYIERTRDAQHSSDA